ncbi:hypothetical protein F2P81_006250 [Scophthalmus maximus]|uniref:Uncharacterized protein n=1 Tax=Scophthalmus maximus TaxID=52904 RepID=A0A6A4TDP4_SCOMX|nr:hypothetical protein F2P81_006250 [Scophthalmus maximus]
MRRCDAASAVMQQSEPMCGQFPMPVCRLARNPFRRSPTFGALANVDKTTRQPLSEVKLKATVRKSEEILSWPASVINSPQANQNLRIRLDLYYTPVVRISLGRFPSDT